MENSGALIIVVILALGIVVLLIASLWKLFEKAGQPGWAAIVPLYSNMVMAEIGGKPNWWGLLACIPYIGIIWGIWILNRFVKSFGKDEGYTIGVILLPFIFLPLLAFSNDTVYQGKKNEEELFEKPKEEY